jgi:predicted GIY-YIG superfamily endonuclease
MSAQDPVLYVLKLESNKWYVGVTNDMTQCMAEHLTAKCKWTHRYKPTVIATKYAVSSSNQEDLLSKEIASLMWMHGINNVRGGDFNKMGDYTISDELKLGWFLFDNLNHTSTEVRGFLDRELPCAVDDDEFDDDED